MKKNEILSFISEGKLKAVETLIEETLNYYEDLEIIFSDQKMSQFFKDVNFGKNPTEALGKNNNFKYLP